MPHFMLLDTLTVSDSVVMMNRALITIITALVAVCIYFLKQVADDIKTTRATVADHSKLLARHGVMYEMWLDELGASLAAENQAENPKRRKTDVIRDLISSLAEKGDI